MCARLNPLGRYLLVLTFLSGSLLVVWGCTGDSGPTEPLGTIVTIEGAFLAGTVTDTKGQAAEGAVLILESALEGRSLTVTRALDEGSGFDWRAKSTGVMTATADGSGRYVFSGLDAGAYLLTSSMRNHQGAHENLVITDMAADKAETTVVDIQLTPTGTLQGYALLENATDHSGSVVYVPGSSYVAVTSATGEYSLMGVPLGNWDVTGMHPGYLDDSDSGTVAAAGDVGLVGDLFLALRSNMAPTAAQLTATVAEVGDTTYFSAVVEDIDGTVMLCEWDFEDDGVFDWSGAGDPASADAWNIYTADGNHRAKLRVTDNKGGIGLAVVDVDVLEALTAVHVAEFGDDNQDGRPSTPVRNIGKAMILAQEAQLDSIKVASGSYFELQLNLVNGISIYGSLDPNNDWSFDAGNWSYVGGPSHAVVADGINQTTVLHGLRIYADPATQQGASSIALTVIDSPFGLEVSDCWLIASAGAAGRPGNLGFNGLSGQPGQSGMPGNCNTSTTVLGGSGGSGFLGGGNGGNGGPADNGNPGINGSGPNGGTGGQGGLAGLGGDDPQGGTNGGQGGSGNDGFGGVAGDPNGFISSNTWTPSSGQSGSNGTPGSGGGGGGGGGGKYHFLTGETTGNGGGGGGAGGDGGTAGGGGQGGGGSFGVFVLNSTLTIDDCEIYSAPGGQGGSGGPGGPGGDGGAGGIGYMDCGSDAGAGGYGGSGGAGGHGGGGGGGAGGPSFCIYAVTSVVNEGTILFTSGVGGLGGDGGSGGNAGEQGPSGLSGNKNY